MPTRLLLATVLVASFLTLLSGADAHTSTNAFSGRYGRCRDPHPKTYTTCPDVGSTIGRYLTIEFMVEKKYCSAIAPQAPGVWAFTNALRIKHGRITGKLDYNNYVPGARNVPDDLGISFRWTGKLLSATRMRLVLKGKVTKAGPAVADCAHVSFTETHDLRAVSF